MSTTIKERRQQVKGNSNDSKQAGRDINITNINISVVGENFQGILEEINKNNKIASIRAEENGQQFKSIALSQFDKELTSEELNAFQEPDVNMCLEEAAKQSVRTNDKTLHEILADLVVQRIKDYKEDFTTLVDKQAIDIMHKLDANLIKLLSFLFVFSKTISYYPNKEDFFVFLNNNCDTFSDLKISPSKLEHLASLACLGINKFADGKLIDILYNCYKHLFLKDDFSIEDVENLPLNENLKNLIFRKNGEQISFNYSLYGMSLKGGEKQNNIPTEKEKKALKQLVNSNVISKSQFEEELKQNVQHFEILEKLWNDNVLSSCNLNATGTTIAITYLNNTKNLGDFLKEIWIN